MADYVSSFRARWWDNQAITVELGPTGTDGISTYDPNWRVHWPDGSSNDFEWLNYINAAGVPWQAKCHAYRPSGSIVLYPQIKHEGTDKDSDNDGHKLRGILVLDPDGNQQTVDFFAQGNSCVFQITRGVSPNH